MMAYLVVYCMFVLLAQLNTSEARPGKPDQLFTDCFEAAGKHYLFVTIQSFTHDKAQEFCKAHGMKLVAVKSKAESDYLTIQISQFRYSDGARGFWTSGERIAPKPSGIEFWRWVEETRETVCW